MNRNLTFFTVSILVGFLAQNPSYAEPRISFTSGRNHFVDAALNSTFRSFFGRSPNAGELPLASNHFNTGIGTGADLALSWHNSHPQIAPGFETRFVLSYGQRNMNLPGGFGIFTDPAKIRINALSASASLGLAQQHALNANWNISTHQNVGMVSTLAQTHVSSALLDVRSRVLKTAGFVAFRAELSSKLARNLKTEASLFLLENRKVDFAMGISVGLN